MLGSAKADGTSATFARITSAAEPHALSASSKIPCRSPKSLVESTPIVTGGIGREASSKILKSGSSCLVLVA